MAQNSLTKQNIGLASKLLRIEEKKAFDKKQQLTEGTPTQALPPESNATRQLQADLAAAADKSGVPVPVGAEPKPDHGETAMGTQDPMGADAPVADQPMGAGQQDGMTRPPDRRGSGAQTPGNDTTSANAESGLGDRSKVEAIENLDGVELIEAFIALCGGVDEAIFKLLAEGVSLLMVESVLVDRKLEEGLFDRVKAGMHSSVGGASKKPSGGYIQHLQKRREQSSSSKPSFVKREQPWSATSSAGHDARRNK